MKKGKKIIVANWKMNPGTLAEARLLFAKIKRAASRLENVLTIICPPFAYLAAFAHSGATRVALGAQNASPQNGGRLTGEVSPEMLRDLGVSYCIVGHSERRALGETDEVIAAKVRAVVAEGMTPILCVGERARDAEGRYFEILKNQLAASLARLPRASFRTLVIAYEPLWAIGKSAREAMSPRAVCETSIFIRKVLTDLVGAENAQQPQILYGGSVEEENTAAILAEGGVDGLLVGHISLESERFITILKRADVV